MTETKAQQYKSLSYLIFVASVTALGGLNIGIVCAIFNATMLQIETSLNWPVEERSFRAGVASGLIPAGSFLGAMLAGYLSDKVGRRKAIIISNIILLSGFIFTYSENFWIFCSGRAVEGIACGAFGVLVPVYIREISPPSISGKMVGAYSIANVIGGILMYSITFALPLTPTNDDQVWKIMYALPAVVAFLQLVLFTFAVKYDTPKYYFLKNKDEEAKKVIHKIYKEEFAHETFERERAAEAPVGVWDMVSKYRYPLAICLFLYFTVQYMGTGMLGYYSTYIFLGTEGGDVANTPAFILQVRFLNLFLALANFPTGILGSYLVDKLGRRTMLLAGSVGITCLLFAFAYFGLDSMGLEQRMAFVALSLVSTLAYGLVISVYISEVVPPKGNSILNTWDNFNQQIVTFLFPMIVNTPEKMNIAFIAFGIVGVLSFPVLWVFVKETKNKTLSEIYQMFRSYSKDKPLLKTFNDENGISGYSTEEPASAASAVEPPSACYIPVNDAKKSFCA